MEKTLKRLNNDPAREALVWYNMFCADRQRHRLSYSQYSSSENPPQTREWFYDDPATADKIQFYVRLPSK